MNRRDFLKTSGLTLLASLPACTQLNTQSLAFVSAGRLAKSFDDNSQDHYVIVGLTDKQEPLWQTSISERAHACTISPDQQRIIVTGRRPSTTMWLLDARTGSITHTIHAQPQRHFFGHSIFDDTGQYLYSTENNTETFAGIISKRSVNQPDKVLKEYSSYGIGCHELHLYHTDNPADNIMVVANGGIKTAQNSRKKLNLDSMQPNLAYIDLTTGKLLQKLSPPHHQLSIRHIDVSHNGKVAIGLQYQGAKTDNVPLLFQHTLGNTQLQPIHIEHDNWLIFNQYIGSVAISEDGQRCMATSPRGHLAVIVDLVNSTVIKKIAVRDCCGVAPIHSKHHQFLISDGTGQTNAIYTDVAQLDSEISAPQHHARTHTGIQFDNHLTAV